MRVKRKGTEYLCECKAGTWSIRFSLDSTCEMMHDKGVLISYFVVKVRICHGFGNFSKHCCTYNLPFRQKPVTFWNLGGTRRLFLNHFFLLFLPHLSSFSYFAMEVKWKWGRRETIKMDLHLASTKKIGDSFCKSICLPKMFTNTRLIRIYLQNYKKLALCSVYYGREYWYDELAPDADFSFLCFSQPILEDFDILSLTIHCNQIRRSVQKRRKNATFVTLLCSYSPSALLSEWFTSIKWRK